MRRVESRSDRALWLVVTSACFSFLHIDYRLRAPLSPGHITAQGRASVRINAFSKGKAEEHIDRSGPDGPEGGFLQNGKATRREREQASYSPRARAPQWKVRLAGDRGGYTYGQDEWKREARAARRSVLLA